MSRLACFLSLAIGCGPVVDHQVLSAKLDRSLSSEAVSSATVELIAPTSKQGAAVDCVSLGETPPLGRDDLRVLFSEVISFASVVEVPEVPVTSEAILWVNAFAEVDALGVPLGSACVDNVTTKPGLRTVIDVVW